ncbi:hypothetical protein HHX47_DHR1001308 [Lentinula edodes]|nr:hypothetical protein HHX47_DHR1001308 [Lentinula edodes]
MQRTTNSYPPLLVSAFPSYLKTPFDLLAAIPLSKRQFFSSQTESSPPYVSRLPCLHKIQVSLKKEVNNNTSRELEEHFAIIAEAREISDRMNAGATEHITGIGLIHAKEHEVMKYIASESLVSVT